MAPRRRSVDPKQRSLHETLFFNQPAPPQSSSEWTLVGAAGLPNTADEEITTNENSKGQKKIKGSRKRPVRDETTETATNPTDCVDSVETEPQVPAKRKRATNKSGRRKESEPETTQTETLACPEETVELVQASSEEISGSSEPSITNHSTNTKKRAPSRKKPATHSRDGADQDTYKLEYGRAAAAYKAGRQPQYTYFLELSEMPEVNEDPFWKVTMREFAYNVFPRRFHYDDTRSLLSCRPLNSKLPNKRRIQDYPHVVVRPFEHDPLDTKLAAFHRLQTFLEHHAGFSSGRDRMIRHIERQKEQNTDIEAHFLSLPVAWSDVRNQTSQKLLIHDFVDRVTNFPGVYHTSDRIRLLSFLMLIYQMDLILPEDVVFDPANARIRTLFGHSDGNIANYFQAVRHRMHSSSSSDNSTNNENETELNHRVRTVHFDDEQQQQPAGDDTTQKAPEPKRRGRKPGVKKTNSNISKAATAIPGLFTSNGNGSAKKTSVLFIPTLETYIQPTRSGGPQTNFGCVTNPIERWSKTITSIQKKTAKTVSKWKSSTHTNTHITTHTHTRNSNAATSATQC